MKTLNIFNEPIVGLTVHNGTNLFETILHQASILDSALFLLTENSKDVVDRLGYDSVEVDSTNIHEALLQSKQYRYVFVDNVTGLCSILSPLQRCIQHNILLLADSIHENSIIVCNPVNLPDLAIDQYITHYVSIASNDSMGCRAVTSNMYGEYMIDKQYINLGKIVE